MGKFTRGLAFLVFVSVLGLVSFFVARAFRGGERPVTAETGPSQQVEPTRPVPPFEGELNGFTFFLPEKVDHAALFRQRSAKCVVSPSGSNVKYVSEEQGKASPLNFTLSYLPAGMRQAAVALSACEDDVIVVGRQYRDAKTGIVGIDRTKGPPMVPASHARERLHPTSIGGRPAVVVSPATPGGRMAIYLRDGTSLWTITGFQIPLDELIKVAEGVK